MSNAFHNVTKLWIDRAWLVHTCWRGLASSPHPQCCLPCDSGPVTLCTLSNTDISFAYTSISGLLLTWKLLGMLELIVGWLFRTIKHANKWLFTSNCHFNATFCPSRALSGLNFRGFRSPGAIRECFNPQIFGRRCYITVKMDIERTRTQSTIVVFAASVGPNATHASLLFI